MKATEIIQSLKMYYKMRRPVFIWGAPGVGKSQVVAQVVDDLKKELNNPEFKLIDLRAIQFDPVDLRGIPNIDSENNVAKWLLPDFWPRSGSGIILIDEMNAAPPSVQASFYELLHDRRLGSYQLPDGFVCFAAGNRETDRAVVNRMATPLANRFAGHIPFDVDLNDWCLWANTHDIRPELVAFLRFRPELLHKMPEGMQKAFPTPRSWQFVSEIVDQEPPRALEFELYQGAVGEGAATEFTAYLRVYRDLPSLDAIIMNPKAERVPESPDVLYAVTAGLVRKIKKENADRIMTYIERLPKEFEVLFVRDAINCVNSFQNTKAFITWATNNSDLI